MATPITRPQKVGSATKIDVADKIGTLKNLKQKYNGMINQNQAQLEDSTVLFLLLWSCFLSPTVLFHNGRAA